jgi:hypothetical protein
MATLNENENVAQQYIKKLTNDIKKKMIDFFKNSNNYQYDYDVDFLLNDTMKVMLQTEIGNDYIVSFQETFSRNTIIHIKINFDNDNDNPTNIAINSIVEQINTTVKMYSKNGCFNCKVGFQHLIPTVHHECIRKKLLKKGVTFCKFAEGNQQNENQQNSIRSVITLDWTQPRDVIHKVNEEEEEEEDDNSVKSNKNDNEENTNVDSKKDSTKEIFKKIIDNKQFDELQKYKNFDLNENFNFANLLTKCKDDNILTYVIDNAINLECEDIFGRRPIHYMCVDSTYKMIKYIIIKYGVNTEFEDNLKLKNFVTLNNNLSEDEKKEIIKIIELKNLFSLAIEFNNRITI